MRQFSHHATPSRPGRPAPAATTVLAPGLVGCALLTLALASCDLADLGAPDVAAVDLVVEAFAAPDTVLLDEAIGDGVEVRVRNAGTADVPAEVPVTVALYVSEDETITTADRLVDGSRGSFDEGIAAGGTVTLTLDAAAAVSSTVPDSAPPIGSRFIGVLVNELADLTESDPDNNAAVRPVEVLARGVDLVVSAFIAPDTALLDDEIGGALSVVVRNAGTADLPPETSVSIGLYLSEDTTITTEDRLLRGGRENPLTGGLPVGDSIVVPVNPAAGASSTFPDSASPLGSRFIGALVDEFDAVAELDEANNTSSRPIQVLARGVDLVVQAFTAPDTVLLDEAIGHLLLLEVRNAGTLDLPEESSVPIGVYVSDDDTITTGDRLLQGGRENLFPGGLAAGESRVIPVSDVANVSSTFPGEAPLLGGRFIGVLVDELGGVVELDETNNTAVEPIEIRRPAVDLVIAGFSAPDTALLDQSLGDRLFIEVRNAGTADLPPETSVPIGVYISSDDVISTGDRLLQGGREDLLPEGLAAGESRVIPVYDAANASSTFPNATPLLGGRFIGVLVDEFDAVDELDETNNAAAEPIELLQPGVDVVIETFTAPDTARLDEPIGGRLFLEVRNAGTVDLPPGTNVSIGFYLSDDETITTTDRLLQGGRENLLPEGLAVGASRVIPVYDGANISSTFPAASPLLGSRFIGVIVDELDSLDELDEDNTAALPIEVLEEADDTGEDQAPTAILSLPEVVSHGTEFTLDGSASSDVEGAIVVYRWTKRSGVGGSLPAGNTVETAADHLVVTPDEPLRIGRHEYQLVVVDDAGNASAPHVRNLTVWDDQPPTAVLRAPEAVSLGADFILRGGASFDADPGSIAVYRWTHVSGSGGSLPEAASVETTADSLVLTADDPLAVGRHTFQLVVIDDSGNESAPDRVDVIVHDDAAPLAILEAPRIVPFGAGFTLHGGRSSDAGGTIVAYRWTHVSGAGGSLPEGATAETEADSLVLTVDPRAPLALGRHVFRLIVVDDSDNESSPATIAISVVDAEAPTAVLRAPASVPYGQGFTLDGAASSDIGGGAIDRYHWSKVSGLGGSLRVGAPVETVADTLPITAADPMPVGRHTYRLVVTDDSGNESEPATVTVTVFDDQPPTAILDAPAKVSAGADIALDGSASSDRGGGTVVSYIWSHVAGPGRSPMDGAVETSSPRLVIDTRASRFEPGTHSFRLVVVDDSGNRSAPAEARVVISG